MTELSPQAQAVMDAVMGQDGEPYPLVIAAALRTAADQLTPYTVSDMDGAAFARNKLLDIAAELERL